MNAKEILREAFDSDIQVLEKAYKSDSETYQTMYVLFSKLLIKLVEKQVLSEKDIVEIMQENEIDKILKKGADIETIWKEVMEDE